MISPENLEVRANTKFGYRLGLPGRRSAEATAVLNAREEAKWRRVDDGNPVQEVKIAETSGRYLVIDSQERKVDEEAMRQRSMARARTALESVAAAVQAGRLKDPAKIGARAARAVARNHGHRYFSWEVSGRGHFRFVEDPDKLAAETQHEDKYIPKGRT